MGLGTRILIQNEKYTFYMQQEGEHWIFREVTSGEILAMGQQACKDGWFSDCDWGHDRGQTQFVDLLVKEL